MKKQTLKTYSLEEITDKHIGKHGTQKRDAFENELRLDLLGEAIKQARLERNLTQEELGMLVGVQKAQISKLENSLTDARFETIIKVFYICYWDININPINTVSCINAIKFNSFYLPDGTPRIII